jgi:hypothetical protein
VKKNPLDSGYVMTILAEYLQNEGEKMHAKTVTKVSAVVASFILSIYIIGGCATVFKGNSSEVDFFSDPSGAQVYVNGVARGTTPINLKLESNKTYTIEFKKEGYEPRTHTITNHVGVGWVVLDVIFGLVPVIVDAATGAWYELDQDAVNAVLEAQQ